MANNFQPQDYKIPAYGQELPAPTGNQQDPIKTAPEDLPGANPETGEPTKTVYVDSPVTGVVDPMNPALTKGEPVNSSNNIFGAVGFEPTPDKPSQANTVNANTVPGEVTAPQVVVPGTKAGDQALKQNEKLVADADKAHKDSAERAKAEKEADEKAQEMRDAAAKKHKEASHKK